MASLLIVCVSTLLSLLSGAVVVSVNRRNAANTLYAFTSLSYILLGVSNYTSTLTYGESKLFFARLVLVFTCLSLVLTYYLVRVLMHTEKNVEKTGDNGITQPALFMTISVVTICLTPLVIRNVVGTSLQFGYGVGIFALFLGYYSYGIVKILGRSAWSPRKSATMRSQARYLLLGFVPVISIAPVTGILLPAVYGDLRFIGLTPAYSALFVMTISYAMIRLKLFDVRFYAIRALIYLLTSLLLAVIYIAPATYVMANVIMGFPFVLHKFIAGVAFATAVALSFEAVRGKFNTITSRIFFKDTYDSAAVLRDFNNILVSTIEIRTLLHSSAGHIAQTFKAEFCLFGLTETEYSGSRYLGTLAKKLSNEDSIKLKKYTDHVPETIVVANHLGEDHATLRNFMIKKDIAAFIRLRSDIQSEKSDFGYILLGHKKSGYTYNTQDIHVLETMANGLMLAIQNSLHFEEIQNFNLTLQETVDQKTLQLRRTNAKLVALDETKDDFISMASHQLRTPLTSVKGYLSMVLEGDAGKVNPMQRKMLAQAFMSSQHMVYLIADLLNVSRLKNGKFVIEPSAINLAAMIQEEIGQLRETAKSRGLTLEYEKPKDFPSLMLDETKTRQVVMNFIDNAIHYTQSGGTVRVELHDKPQTVELRVVDNGIGVPKNEQPHLFTKFYRAGNARRERPDGTGLGLFMAKKVVVAQGGAILFDSKEAKGSTFGFSLSKTKLAVPAADAKI